MDAEEVGGMIEREVVLVGGGAAHLVALRHLAMRPLPPEVRLTLVVPEPEQPYSGMVPGVMAGRIARDTARVDLAALARASGARLVLGEAVGLDRAARLLRLAADRPPLRYDLLSLSIGAEPALVPGAAEHALPLKP
ncbi:MAG: bifunctional NADH dehydrogenase FAD-containing subunit/selenide, water dikinase SelD, partial [Acetobacteraceae bacterium]